MNVVKLLVLLSILAAFAYADDMVSLSVRAPEIDDSSTFNNIFRTYIGDYATGVVEKGRVVAAIEYLSKAGNFENLLLDSSSTPWVLTASPSYIIRDIRFTGEYPLMEKDLTKALTIHSGSFYSDKDMIIQIRYLLKKMSEHGYLVAQSLDTTDSETSDIALLNNGNAVYSYLNVSVDTVAELGFVDITIAIEKSKPFLVEQLEYIGNERYTDFWCGFIFNGWRYRIGHSPRRSRFIHEDLSNDIKKLRNYYYKRDFPECQITDSVYIDSVEQDVFITLRINEGPRYKIKPQEVKPLSRYTVRQLFDFSERGNHGDYTLRRQVKALERKYKSRGYVHAQVTWQDSLHQKRSYVQRRILLTVDTGSREKVSSVTLTGNTSYGTKELLSLMGTQVRRKVQKNGAGCYVPTVFRSDIKRIENYYYTRGFLNVAVEGESKLNRGKLERSVDIQIHEGIQCFLDTIIVEGLSDSLRQILGHKGKLKQKAAFNPIYLKDDLNEIKSLISDQGYPHVVLDYTADFSQDSSTVTLRVKAALGPFVTIGNILHRGNFKSSGEHFNKLMRVSPNEPLSLSKLYKGIRRLRDVDILTSVTYKIPGIKDSLYDTLDILLNYEEEKPFVFEGRVGFDSRKRFNTRLSIANLNFLGKSKHLTLSGWYSLVEFGSDITYMDPYLFYTDFRLTARVYAMVEELLDNDRVNTAILGNSYQLNYEIKENTIVLGALGAYEIRNMIAGNGYRSNDDEVDSAGIDTSLFGDIRQVLYLTPSLTLDYRDSFLRPKKGLYNYIDITGSKGITIDEDNFLRIKEDLRGYVSLGRKVVFAARVGCGLIHGYGESDTVVSDQLLKIGGIQNVRGYAEDKLYPTSEGKDAAPTFGYGTLYGSFEARIEMLPILEIAGFIDVGTLTSEPNLQELRLPRFSVGGGLLYITPIGPIGLLYAHRLYVPGDSYVKSDGHGRFHFSIGYTF